MSPRRILNNRKPETPLQPPASAAPALDLLPPIPPDLVHKPTDYSNLPYPTDNPDVACFNCHSYRPVVSNAGYCHWNSAPVAAAFTCARFRSERAQVAREAERLAREQEREERRRIARERWAEAVRQANEQTLDEMFDNPTPEENDSLEAILARARVRQAQAQVPRTCLNCMNSIVNDDGLRHCSNDFTGEDIVADDHSCGSFIVRPPPET